ncbi:MAG: PDZ domain-containing protein [Planctomycetota bacterium]|jgi:S1-C subfamily serine protease
MRRIAIVFTFSLFVCAPRAAADDLMPKLRQGLVKVAVTSQSYDYTSPWKKTGVRNSQGRGFVVSPGVILTLAGNVRDALMIEVMVANSARRYPAKLKHVDTRMGLALVEITDEELRAQLKPLQLGESVKLDDEFDIYELGRDNMVERATARVVRADASPTVLSLRVQTTGTGGGDGQVALKDGKVVGLLTSRSRQQGMITSIESIEKYLKDHEDGDYKGCPGSSVWIQTLLREDLREFYGLGKDQHGIGVVRTVAGRTGEGVLKKGDVILAVDGYDVDDEGKFKHERHGRLSVSWLFQGRRYPGDSMKLKILRDGKEQEVTLELKAWPDSVRSVPSGPGEGRPQYLVVGGLVILELHERVYIPRSPGGVFLRRYSEREGWDPAGERRRYVYVDRVFADESNKGFEGLRYTPVDKINGMLITEIADVAKALGKPKGEFHVFEFQGVASDFVIPAAKLKEIDERVSKNYRIPKMRHLRGDPE